LFANGNILYHSDIQKCLEFTGADAVMSAEGNLYNPALFSTVKPHPFHADLALEYLEIVKSLKTRTSPGAVKGHLFKLFHPALHRNKDLRDRLGKLHGDDIDQYIQIAQEMKERMDVSIISLMTLFVH
jgi:tRNA-dihydrouridine synthase 1